jgi:starch synthase (maltosyl-transferring)
MPADPPQRLLIRNPSPATGSGRSPVERCVGDRVVVEADIYREGRQVLHAVVLYHRPQMSRAHHERGFWREAQMLPIDAHLDGVRWAGSFEVDRAGTWKYTIEAWTDLFGTWREGVARKVQRGQAEVGREMYEGIGLLRESVDTAENEADRALIEDALVTLEDPAIPEATKHAVALGPELSAAVERVQPRHGSVVLEHPVMIEVKPAQSSARDSDSG